MSNYANAKISKRNMTKSQRPSLSECRRALRLVGDIRDLGHDSQLWHQRLADGMIDLLNAHTAIAGEWKWVRPGCPLQPVQIVTAGLSDASAPLFRRYVRENRFSTDPFYVAISRRPRPAGVVVRRELVPDHVWYQCPEYTEFFYPSGLDCALHSNRAIANVERVDIFTIRRASRQPPFSLHDKRLAMLLHHEVSRLIGTALSPLGKPGIRGLPPRLRNVLEGVLHGHCEKQIAESLDISPTTLHDHIARLYAHFHVHSRTELVSTYLYRSNPTSTSTA